MLSLESLPGPPFKLAHSNPTHSNFVNCVRYSRDGSSIASVGTDKKVRDVWLAMATFITTIGI